MLYRIFGEKYRRTYSKIHVKVVSKQSSKYIIYENQRDNYEDSGVSGDFSTKVRDGLNKMIYFLRTP